MGRERSKREKEIRRRLFLTVGALFVVLLLVGFLLWRHFRIDTTEGVAKLKEMDEIDVQQTDAAIQKLEDEERQSDEAWQNRSNNEKFKGCIVLGDSIAQGLYEYNVLDEAYVAAKKGVGTHDQDSEDLAELIKKAKKAKPQKVFLAFGMNDIGYSGGADAFKTNYAKTLKRIRDALPEAEIYVNGILPANDKALASKPAFADVSAYNETLQELCAEEELTFIDNTDLVQDSYYADDGIHMQPEYYPEWADHMAEAAQL